MAYERSDFRHLFYQECDRCLSELDAAAARLDPVDPAMEPLVVAHRMVHTISGGAAIVGFDDIAAYSRKVERLLGALTERSIEASADALDALEEARRILHALVDARRNDRPVDADGVERSAARLVSLAGDADER